LIATESYRPIPVVQLRRALASLLLEYRRSLDAVKQGDSPLIWVRRLFDALGWDQTFTPATLRFATKLPTAEIFQGDLFGYSAFTLAVVPPDSLRPWEERTDEVLTYLYNRGDEWAVISDFDQLDIVNVRWTEKQQRLYVPFRRICVEDYPREAETLALLTPARLHQRDLYQQAAVEAPRKPFDRANSGERTLRPPITEAVLDRILNSRKAFLSAPPEGETDALSYDAQIHQLLMRLIFVRACEDMGVGVSEPIKTTLTSSDPRERLRVILEDYHNLYASELFSPLDLEVFHPGPLKEAITSLYGWPGVVEFNFAAIEADILGMMYEEYLQWRAVRKEIETGGVQQIIFSLERVTTENIKREKGIYYTPSFLVEAMVDRAFELAGAPKGWLPDGRPVLAADLACGSGAFLAVAFRKIATSHVNQSYQAAADLLVECIAGVDSDPRAVEATRLNLWLTLFRLHPEVHPLPYLSGVVFSQDALLGPLLPRTGSPSDSQDLFRVVEENGGALSFHRRPDVLLGNPPFVPIERLHKSYQRILAGEDYETVTGRFDLANVFVERAVKIARTNGVIALVVPNRIFTTSSAASLRRFLSENAVLEEIIDFGTEQIFPATTYVSVIFVRAGKGLGRTGLQTRVVRIDKLVEPRGLQLRESLGATSEPPGVRRYEVRFPRSDAPVLLLPGNASSLLGRLRRSGIAVSEIAYSKQGIRTGEQNLFLVIERPNVGRTNDLLPVRSFGPVEGSVRQGEIERDILRPAVHSEDIKRYADIPEGVWLIYPYENGQLIPLDEFEERFPKTWHFLGRHRSLLARRARVQPHTWHSLSLPRDETWLSAAKLLVPELANVGRMTVDSKGFYVVQGFGIVINEGVAVELEALLAVLNSTLLVWQTAMSAPRFRGNAFRYHSSILDSLSLPRALVDDQEFHASASGLAKQLLRAYNDNGLRKTTTISELEAEADALVYTAAKLSTKEIQLIEDEVARFRPATAAESVSRDGTLFHGLDASALEVAS
jgi:type I restriction-modification system DNA methylase subunit